MSSKAYETQVLVNGTCFSHWKIQGHHERETESSLSDGVLKHELESDNHNLVVVEVISYANQGAVIAFMPVEIGVAS